LFGPGPSQVEPRLRERLLRRADRGDGPASRRASTPKFAGSCWTATASKSRGGLGPLAGRTFRIGVIGPLATEANLDLFFEAFGKCMAVHATA
jgi:aspartate aminotransferase-like enzyme